MKIYNYLTKLKIVIFFNDNILEMIYILLLELF